MGLELKRDYRGSQSSYDQHVFALTISRSDRTYTVTCCSNSISLLLSAGVSSGVIFVSSNLKTCLPRRVWITNTSGCLYWVDQKHGIDLFYYAADTIEVNLSFRESDVFIRMYIWLPISRKEQIRGYLIFNNFAFFILDLVQLRLAYKSNTLDPSSAAEPRG